VPTRDTRRALAEELAAIESEVVMSLADFPLSHRSVDLGQRLFEVPRAFAQPVGVGLKPGILFDQGGSVVGNDGGQSSVLVELMRGDDGYILVADAKNIEMPIRNGLNIHLPRPTACNCA